MLLKIGGEEEGEKAAVRFGEAIGANNSITELSVYCTDVVRLNSVERCGSALMKNKTMTKLTLRSVEDGDEM